MRNCDHPFMLYHACLDPFSHHEPTLQLYKLLLLDNLLIVCYHLVIILGNLYLFLFLRSQTERNTALSGIDY